MEDVFLGLHALHPCMFRPVSVRSDYVMVPACNPCRDTMIHCGTSSTALVLAATAPADRTESDPHYPQPIWQLGNEATRLPA